MADDRPKSPAPRWLRSVIAGAFVAVWAAVLLYDFFANPGANVVPLWFQATGLVVLGYLLGLNVEDITHGLK